MNVKLTIQLDDNLIHAAKTYARGKNVSLSKMIESYLKFVTSEESQMKDTEITPLVKSLSGVIELSPEFDYKTEYGNHLLEKYK
ncbi:MAG: DUF6364 family protein [Bacteroidales bacterium]|jgi:hypothetical protein|nr:DUF6364 family protein [Bacteroidales bacterium]